MSNDPGSVLAAEREAIGAMQERQFSRVRGRPARSAAEVPCQTPIEGVLDSLCHRIGEVQQTTMSVYERLKPVASADRPDIDKVFGPREAPCPPPPANCPTSDLARMLLTQCARLSEITEALNIAIQHLEV